MEKVTLPSGLYLVATPIGNLRDMTLRAQDVLAGADFIVCEDTRVTGKLLNAYGIEKRMMPYNDHNAPQQRGPILEALGAGRAVALVSDAGTPLVSDPGYKLVRDCLDLGIMVTAVPGPSAVLSALLLSGLPSDKFSFLGFLPPKSAARRKTLSEWKQTPATLVLFETGPRLAESLKDIKETLGDRPAAVVREITKIYEESRRGRLSELLSHYDGAGAPKGEIVVVVGPAPEEVLSDEALAERLRAALQSMSVRDAAAFVAEATGAPKKKLYDMALQIEKERG